MWKNSSSPVHLFVMQFILIPVKDLSKANNRLASVLSQEDRTSLAYAMLEDVFNSAGRSRFAKRIVVVTLDERAERMAKERGFYVIVEKSQNGESSSVDDAILECKNMGATSVTVIPGDAPLIQAEDIDLVLANEPKAPCVVMAPAADMLGTNAILRNPPDIIPSRFGHDSYRKHMKEAENAGARAITLDIPRIALDIDEPKDIDEFLKYSSDTCTLTELERLGFRDVKKITA